MSGGSPDGGRSMRLEGGTFASSVEKAEDAKQEGLRPGSSAPFPPRLSLEDELRTR